MITNVLTALNVGCNAHFLPLVLGAALEHASVPVLEHDFGLEAVQALRVPP